MALRLMQKHISSNLTVLGYVLYISREAHSVLYALKCFHISRRIKKKKRKMSNNDYTHTGPL